MRFFMDGSGRSPNAGWSWRNTTLVAGMALLSSLAVGIGAAGGLSVLDESGTEPKPPAPAEAKARALVPLPVDPLPPPEDNTAEAAEPPTKAEPGSGASDKPDRRPSESKRPAVDKPGLGDRVDESATLPPAESETKPVEPGLPEAHTPESAPSWLHVGGELPQWRQLSTQWRQLELGTPPNGSGWGEHAQGSGQRNSGWDESGSTSGDSGWGGGDSSNTNGDSGWRGRDSGSAPESSGWGQRDSGSRSAGSDEDGGGSGSRTNGSGWG